MPSIGRSCSASSMPKHGRPMEPSSNCGVHVMRIAAFRTNHLPFASCGPRRLRALGSCSLSRAGVNPLVARPPSTRLLLRPGFRPVHCRGRASLSPKTTYRLLQYDDVRAPTAGRRILDRDEGRRCSSSTFALSSLLRGHASDEPRDPHASEDARAPWTGRPERRFVCLSADEAPPRTGRAPLCRARGRVKRTVVPLPQLPRAPG